MKSGRTTATLGDYNCIWGGASKQKIRRGGARKDGMGSTVYGGAKIRVRRSQVLRAKDCAPFEGAGRVNRGEVCRGGCGNGIRRKELRHER